MITVPHPKPHHNHKCSGAEVAFFSSAIFRFASPIGGLLLSQNEANPNFQQVFVLIGTLSFLTKSPAVSHRQLVA